jgi:hypothetical protein
MRRGMFAVEKGMSVVVVASIEWRRPFIGSSDPRKDGNKAWEEARRRWKKERDQAVACEWRQHVEEAFRRVGEAQHRWDVSHAPASPLRQSSSASFVCK